MAENRKSIKLTSLDDLFSTEESRTEADKERIQDIPIAEIDGFPDHPFHVDMDDAMSEMVESVKRFGVLSPAVARQKENGRYELISGHRRKKACERAGIDKMPVIVRNMDRDEAIIFMVDSNLQRERLLPSEKAFSYKMKMEALKRQGNRSDLTSTPVVSKLRTNEQIGQTNSESREQVRRYIRLTELTPALLQMVASNLDHPTPSGLPHIPPAVPTDTLQIHPANPARISSAAGSTEDLPLRNKRS